MNISKVSGILISTLALGISANAWSGIALENPLGDSYYSQPIAPKIDMTDIALSYSGWRPHRSNVIKGHSTRSTVLTLIGPGSSSTLFEGNFKMRAYVTPKGKVTGGSFSFTSNDSMFGFGSTCKASVCTANTGTVFRGKFDSIGWSKSKRFLEFGTSQFSGWACAQGWCTSSERLFFNMTKKNLGLAAGNNTIKQWKNMGNGSAVIPVPAAAWLFGSGLIGLLGAAKRKKN